MGMTDRSNNVISTKAALAGRMAPFQTVFFGTSHRKAFTAVASQVTLGTNTEVIRVFPSADCWIATGANPTAVKLSSDGSGPSSFLPGGIIQWVLINHGDKLSVVSDTEVGELHIVEGESQ